MSKIIWQPTEDQVILTEMDKFRRLVNGKFHLQLKSYEDLHNWSVNSIPEFWGEIWEYGDIIHSVPYTEVVDDLAKMPGAKWFSGARLNYAENLLCFRDNKIALVFQGEDQPVRSLTYAELYDAVIRLASSLREAGVAAGDRVAGFMPNMPESVIAMLASASIGAIWSSSSPDFGIKGSAGSLLSDQTKNTLFR